MRSWETHNRTNQQLTKKQKNTRAIYTQDGGITRQTWDSLMTMETKNEKKNYKGLQQEQEIKNKLRVHNKQKKHKQ